MTAMKKKSIWLALVACCIWLCAGCGPGETPKEKNAKPAAAKPAAKTAKTSADKTAAPKTADKAAAPKKEQPRSPSEEIPPPSTAAAKLPPETKTPPDKSHPPAADLTAMMYVFLLSALIGLGVITRVSRLLHTPLMSLTNAISAIAVIGAITVAGSKHHWFINFLGAVALFASTTNIVSGFLITDRMLKMFKKQEPRP
jgi:NAD(P) transhydrogenase subunit alpha